MNVSVSMAKAVRWSGIGRTLAQVFRWAMTLIVIRILMPEDYGLVALAMTVFNLVGAVYEMGLAPAVIQAKKLDDDDLRRISGLVVVLSLVIYLAFYISAPWFALLWDEPRLVEILRTLALVFPIASIATVPLAILRREMDFKSVTIINFAAEMVGAITTLILALTGFGVWSLVLGHLAYAVMGTVLPLIFCPVRVIPSFNFKSTGRFIDFGGSIILQRLVHQIYTSADVIILGRAFDTATVGVYSVALEVATMPLRKITTIVNELAFAGFSRIQDDKEKIAGYLEKAFRFLLLFGLPIFAGMSSVAPELVAVVLGPTWMGATLPLQLLCLVVPLRLFADPLHEVLNGIGQQRLSSTCMLIIAAVVITALLLGVPFGVYGLCIAWLVSMPVAFTFLIIRSAPHTGLGALRFLRMAWPSLTACVLMYLAVLMVGMILPWPVDHPLRLATLVSSGALIYGTAMLLLRPGDIVELWRFLRN